MIRPRQSAWLSVRSLPVGSASATWHTNLDTFERIIESDAQQSAMTIASLLYHLAMRDEMLPRSGGGDPMSELFEPTSDDDWRLTRGGHGLLSTFNAEHLLNASDVHVAARVGELGGESDDRVLLAVALAVRATRRGSVCLDLATAHESAPQLPWPDPTAWQEAVTASPLVTAGVVRWDLDRLYLDRYHRLETQVCDDLRARTDTIETPVDEARLEATAALLRGTRVSEQQLQAAMNAARHRTTILTGGPGTGKTTTVARMLVLLADQAEARDEKLSIALAAPTGKAATRLEEAVEAGLTEIAEASPQARAAAERVGHPRGVTLHRLLGWRPDSSTRFRHDRSNRLKFDVVVVDESSMVELTMMGRLLEALRPQARLVLVGDPEQLTSVGANSRCRSASMVRTERATGENVVVETYVHVRSLRFARIATYAE